MQLLLCYDSKLLNIAQYHILTSLLTIAQYHALTSLLTIAQYHTLSSHLLLSTPTVSLHIYEVQHAFSDAGVT